MKPILLLFPALPALTAIALAQSANEPSPPPPVAQTTSPAITPPGAPPENQRVYGPSSDALIARETANGILENFRKTYTVTNAPRIVVYVNRELVDTTSGLKLTARKERFAETTTAGKEGTTSTTT